MKASSVACLVLVVLGCLILGVSIVWTQNQDGFYLVVVLTHWWQGSPIGNVTVTVTQYGTNETFTAITNDQGRANFGNLPTDYYEINIPSMDLSQGVYHRSNETVYFEYGFWFWADDLQAAFMAIQVFRIPLWLIIAVVLIAAFVYVVVVRV